MTNQKKTLQKKKGKLQIQFLKRTKKKNLIQFNKKKILI